MRLASFQVKHFKSIVDTGICKLSENDNIVVFAGQNEAGKSAVIEALNFFGNGPSDKFERLHRRREDDPEVHCEFILSPEDIQAVFDKTKSDALKKDLQKNNRIGLVRVIASDGTFDDIFLSDETEQRIKTLLTPPASAQKKPEEKAKAATSEGDSAEAVAEPVPSEEAPAPAGVDDVEQLFVELMRDFVFYDSFEALLPGLTTIKEIPNHPAVQDFEKVFDVDFAKIVQKDPRGINRAEQDLHKRASDDLNKYWTQKLEQGSKYNFTVKIIRKEPVEESTVEFLVDREDGDPLYLEQKSNGFRWFSAFNLRLRALGVDEKTIKNLIILIDEPGQGLHEKAQKDLKKVIEELGGRGAQIIYTTHYPNLIGTLGKEFPRIRLVSNNNGTGTLVETVAQFASRPDVGAADALSPLITAMGIQSIGTLIDKVRRNVVVEGITDHYYLSALRTILGKDDTYHFIPACGVTNVPNLVSVLIGWGFDYKAVFDDDKDSGRKAYNLLKKEFYEDDDALAHEHILKISGCTGIEDIFSPSDFHKLVLDTPLPSGTVPTNSTLAHGKKEVLARLFLEKAEQGAIKLDKDTTAKAEEVFKWLKEKFGI